MIFLMKSLKKFQIHILYLDLIHEAVLIFFSFGNRKIHRINKIKKKIIIIKIQICSAGITVNDL